jgi:hypothetical protein
MATQYWLKLTKTEAEHLLTLIERNEDKGWYYAPKEQYWNRSERIKKKLQKISTQTYNVTI